jgi:flavin-dependent dehydrogenase
MADVSFQAQVTVMGGGLAGMAISLNLARAGFDVTCIEAGFDASRTVGESLDWSAPELLRSLGLSMTRLLEERAATYKRHVTLQLGGGYRCYVPGEWLGRPPYNVELKTLHVDRESMDREIRGIALGRGVKLIHDRVTGVESKAGRVNTVVTAGGKHFSSPWFVDASGSAAAVLPRHFDLPSAEYGPRKVAMWTHFPVSEASEGTTIYSHDDNPTYMNWLWEIPIRPDVISVGYVATGEAIKEQRRRGLSLETIFRSQLALFPRFQELLREEQPLAPFVTSYQCRVHRNIAGPNWLVVGEAAAMVDPMTSNGVTAALRHAEEAAELLVRSKQRQRLPRVASALYCRRAREVARFFNIGIEHVIYQAPIRNRIGTLMAGDVYTVPAWSLNHLYTRFRPRGIAGSLLFSLLLRVFTVSCTAYAGYAAFSKRNPANCGATA